MRVLRLLIVALPLAAVAVAQVGHAQLVDTASQREHLSHTRISAAAPTGRTDHDNQSVQTAGYRRMPRRLCRTRIVQARQAESTSRLARPDRRTSSPSPIDNRLSLPDVPGGDPPVPRSAS